MENTYHHGVEGGGGGGGVGVQENLFHNNSGMGIRQQPLLLTPHPFVYNNGNEFFQPQV